MATNFQYASVSDLTKYFNRVDDFDSKRQIFPTETSGNNHFFRNVGHVDTLFVNGSEQASAQADFDSVTGNGQWCYRSDNNDLKYQNSNFTTTVNEQVFEAGYDFTDFLNLVLEDASSELHNYIDARYSTPILKAKLIDHSTVPTGIGEEYDPIILKSTCYIAAANMIRAKEGASEEADYFHSLVTNPERTGLIDKLNDGIYKLSFEVDANDKNGKVVYQSVSDGGLDIVELAGEYRGEHYDMLNVDIDTAGAYGTATFTVKYLSNNQLEGATSSAKIITGGLQEIHNGLYGRFQGNSAVETDNWRIEVYGSHRKQTNKSNATIEMVR